MHRNLHSVFALREVIESSVTKRKEGINVNIESSQWTGNGFLKGLEEHYLYPTLAALFEMEHQLIKGYVVFMTVTIERTTILNDENDEMVQVIVMTSWMTMMITVMLIIVPIYLISAYDVMMLMIVMKMVMLMITTMMIMLMIMIKMTMWMSMTMMIMMKTTS